MINPLDKAIISTEISNLPELSGEFPIGENPVDIYLAGKSKHTQRMVKSHLNKISILFGYDHYQTTPWCHIRYHHVQKLIGLYVSDNYSPSTINTMLAAIRGTAKACFNLYQISGDDLQRILSVQMIKGSRLSSGRFIPTGELTSLVNVCANDNSPAGIRDISIIGTLFIGGLRRSEAANLKIKDINVENCEIRLIGKGNKERKVFIDSGTQSAIQDWLKLKGESGQFLFSRVLKNGRILDDSITDQAIYNMLQKRWKQAGIPSVSPHDFRRTFISTLLSKGVDVLTVQKMAGHSDPKTTSAYDLRPEENMKSATSLLHLPYSPYKKVGN